MRLWTGAACALLSTASLDAQTARDLGTATPVEGNWTYAATPAGTDATFVDSLAMSQVWVHCTRSTRRVTLAKRASDAAPLLSVWTSSSVRDVPSTFDSVTGRLTVDLAPFDPLLDAIATSRGRIGLTIGTEPSYVVPAWAEPAHVIEDCRA